MLKKYVLDRRLSQFAAAKNVFQTIYDLQSRHNGLLFKTSAGKLFTLHITEETCYKIWTIKKF